MWNDLCKSRSLTSNTKWALKQPNISWIKQHFIQHFLSGLFILVQSKILVITKIGNVEWNVGLHLRPFSTGSWAAWLRQFIPHFLSLYRKFLCKHNSYIAAWSKQSYKIYEKSKSFDYVQVHIIIGIPLPLCSKIRASRLNREIYMSVCLNVSIWISFQSEHKRF